MNLHKSGLKDFLETKVDAGLVEEDHDAEETLECEEEEDEAGEEGEPAPAASHQPAHSAQ